MSRESTVSTVSGHSQTVAHHEAIALQRHSSTWTQSNTSPAPLILTTTLRRRCKSIPTYCLLRA
jgi:hypothetical protein